jgi:putative aldouronate transport system permease protein
MRNWKTNKKDLIFDIIVYSLLILITLAILLPFAYTVLSSFATRHEILTRGFFIFPKDWTLEAYGYLMNHRSFTTAFKNAIHVTVVGTTINIIMTTLMAYGLSQRWLKGRSLLNFMVIFTMLFHGGMIPTYLVVSGLGLINSYWALWLVTAIAPFNLIVMRSFFQNIPQELLESARMDGCGEWRMLLKIIIPLSLPVIFTFTLFYTVGNWNTYFHAILFLNDADKFPLQVFLRQMLIVDDSGMDFDVEGGFQYSPAVRNAAIFLTALPLLVIYPFFQKHFKKGMLLGSIKG